MYAEKSNWQLKKFYAIPEIQEVHKIYFMPYLKKNNDIKNILCSS